MNAAQQHMAALSTLYGRSPNELRADVSSALARAAELGRNLPDQYAVQALAIQLEGIQRTLRQLGPMLAREANPDART